LPTDHDPVSVDSVSVDPVSVDPPGLFDPFTINRPPPGGIITTDFEDLDLGVLKTGKEAEVSLVERCSTVDDRVCLLARKRYRPRTVGPGELKALGFTRAGGFRNDLIYRDGRKYAKSRDQRAVDRMSGRGKELIKERWVHHEFMIMRRAWNARVSVPYPVGLLDDGFVMDYLGDDESAAPRLRQVRLSPARADTVFGALIDDVARLAGAGIVHADLSPYNVLWWDDRHWLIDFPQAVDVASPHGLEFLRRDVSNLVGWFSRHGGIADPDRLVDEILATTHR
jgi:RIO kinase 1